MTQHRPLDAIQADIERAQAWRSRWICLANDQVRLRRMGGLQSQMDFIICRANAANRRIARLMDEADDVMDLVVRRSTAASCQADHLIAKVDAAIAAAQQGVSPVSPVSPPAPVWHLAENMPNQPRGWYWAPFPGQWVFYSPERNQEMGVFHGTTDWQPLAAKRYWGPCAPMGPDPD